MQLDQHVCTFHLFDIRSDNGSLLGLVDLGEMPRGTVQHRLANLGPLDGSDRDAKAPIKQYSASAFWLRPSACDAASSVRDPAARTSLGDDHWWHHPPL